MPESFAAQLDILNNGEAKTRFDFVITAIPMYNLREEALKFHTKGRGNGYVIEKEDKRVYFSGDTEDIPEMRALENIDFAFICMNLPYTMTEAKAAEAVLAFKPKTVLPYHYRGTDGLSDLFAFKTAVNRGNSNIDVLLMDWYPED
jgi:L-ascorbate metabolism protein UlaG (beta-lactamase superfamily)